MSVKRKTSRRCLAGLFTEARQELIAQKRDVQLERMLLPDAPPRTRPKKGISPERESCIMVVPPVRLSVDYSPIKRVEAEASTSGVACSSELNFSEPTEFECSMSDIGAEVVLPASSSPYISRPSDIGVIDENINGTIEKWLDEVCSSDDDLDIDDANVSLAIVQERDAAQEPACDSDLTVFQEKVLQREDVANDRALRNILSEELCTFSWSKYRSTFLGRREIFTGTPGPTFTVTDRTRAIDIFDKMFDFDFIDLLCTETNRNAEQKIALMRKQNKLAPHSRFNRWTPTNRDEMVSFLAIIILQGLYPLTEEQGYFTFNGFGTMTYFARIMTYNRFMLLKSFLHFVNNETLQSMTRLCKIRPVIDYFNAKFSSLYMPAQEIAIDESLLKWHGRLSFSQKIKSKAAQIGVKTYELCESSSGYLWRFFVYAGKDKPTLFTSDGIDGRDTEKEQKNERPFALESLHRFDEDETNDSPNNDVTIVASPDKITTDEIGERPTNATAIIVYNLIQPLLHRGHTVIMDNFYNSPLLLRCLKKQKTDCYGTLRLNREFVPNSVKTLTKTDLRRGEVVATYCDDLSILVWRDANIVSMISTYHNLQIGIQDKNNRQTHKPSIVLDYNKYMGGVDRKDQFLSAQPLERARNKIWYKKLFRRLYNAAIFNCFVIFTSFHRKISHRQFRIVLAEDLLRRHRKIDLTTDFRRLNVRSNTTGKVKTTQLRRNARPKTQDRPTIESNHFPIRTGSKHTCCSLCPKKTRTIWKCEECDVNLCIEGCFKAYHK